jgi:hypothetical protein
MRTADANVFQDRALMPFSDRRLTRFWATSKLFFAASQLAAQVQAVGITPRPTFTNSINAEQNYDLFAPRLLCSSVFIAGRTLSDGVARANRTGT